MSLVFRNSETLKGFDRWLRWAIQVFVQNTSDFPVSIFTLPVLENSHTIRLGQSVNTSGSMEFILVIYWIGPSADRSRGAILIDNSPSLRPGTYYAKELKQVLPPEVFERNPWQLMWLIPHLAIIAASISALLLTNIHWGYRLLLAAAIGHSYGCLMYLAHEILHGTVVKNSTLQNWLSGICMLPYCISPEHWKAWHNRSHHCHTSKTGRDPDSFGDVYMNRKAPFAKFTTKLAPGSGYLRSWFFMGFWFSFHALVTLFVHSKVFEYWKPAQRRKQLALFSAMVAFWAGVGYAVGPYNFAFVYLLPMVVANCVQMFYISTNHLFCDETQEENDPLINSLTVSTPRWVSWLHLNFGYHVEHHVMPYANSKHAPKIQAALKEHFGTRYHEMPLQQALRVLYETPPVHLSRQELVNMRTGVVYSTLGPNGELPRVVDQVAVPVRPRKRMKNRPAVVEVPAPESSAEDIKQNRAA